MTFKELITEAKVKQGSKFGVWAVTKFEDIQYDDLGSIYGGYVKLVNQDTMDTIEIRNDNALRGNKWFVSLFQRKVIDTSLSTVIDRAIKVYEDNN